MRVSLLFCTLLLITAFQASAKIGSVLREAKIADLVQKAVPDLQYQEGDKSWNGGMYTNALISGSSFDSNTSHAVYSSTSEISSTEIASTILRALAEDYKLPTTTPSSLWIKQTPLGLNSKDYGMAFLSSYGGNQRMEGIEYVTVEVSRISARKCAISITYVCVKKE